MRELDLTTSEAIDYAALNAAVIAPTGRQLNPYLLGLRIWEEMERTGGTEQLFAVRESEADVSFLRNYMTESMVAQVAPGWSKEQLVHSRINGGHPSILVLDGDWQRQGQLRLQHVFDGNELDARHLEKTLAHVQTLWGAPVHLETVRRERPIRCSHDGRLFEVTDI
jgi:stage V sporulation protein R